MWSPSATRAIEPNIRPPTISAIIMAVQSQITSQVLRSLFSCPSPRNTWLWKVGLGALSLIANLTSDKCERFRVVARLLRRSMPSDRVGIDKVHSHMVVDHFG